MNCKLSTFKYNLLMTDYRAKGAREVAGMKYYRKRARN